MPTTHTLLAVLLMLTTFCASAAELVIEELLVTARKRSESLQEISVAVTVISAQDIQGRGLRDLNELQQLAPSLTVDRGSSTNSARFGIRGISTGSENISLESSVGLYVDGVYRTRQGSMINNLLDIERVEVLRGPQGTLFGRNTPSGAVLVSSVKPDHQTSGFIEIELGKWNSVELNGAYTTSIADTLALRVSGFTMQRDGYVSDASHGNNVFNDRDRQGIRAQALYTPTPELDIRLIADWSKLKERCCAAGSWKNNVLAQDLPAGSPSKPGTDALLLSLGKTVIPDNQFYQYRTALSTPSESENHDGGLSAQIDWRFDEYLLTSITAIRQYGFDDFGDADFSDIRALSGGVELDDEQISQELRVSRDLTRGHWVAGLYGLWQESDSAGGILIGNEMSLLTGLPGSAFPPNTGAYANTRQENKTLAVFGQVDVDLSKNITLSTGLRWSKEQKNLQAAFTEDASDSLDFSSPGWGFWLVPPLTPRDDARTSLDDEQVTGTVQISWQVLPSTLVYASWGNGYKSGGINTSRLDPSIDPLFEAESSQAYELGLKTELPGKAIRMNIALHHTETDDLQTVAFNGIGFNLQNAGKARAYGAEIDLIWIPVEALSLGLVYAYNKAEFVDFANGTCWVSTPWHTGQADPGDNGDGSCDRSGDRIPDNAEHRGALTLQWHHMISPQISADITSEYAFSSDRVTAQNNDPETRDGSYGLLNLRLGLNYLPWRIAAVVWGRNLTSETYRSTSVDAPLQAGRVIAFYNEPRSWGVSLRKDF